MGSVYGLGKMKEYTFTNGLCCLCCLYWIFFFSLSLFIFYLVIFFLYLFILFGVFNFCESKTTILTVYEISNYILTIVDPTHASLKRVGSFPPQVKANSESGLFNFSIIFGFKLTTPKFRPSSNSSSFFV